MKTFILIQASAKHDDNNFELAYVRSNKNTENSIGNCKNYRKE